jgi:hypothetical protein
VIPAQPVPPQPYRDQPALKDHKAFQELTLSFPDHRGQKAILVRLGRLALFPGRQDQLDRKAIQVLLDRKVILVLRVQQDRLDQRVPTARFQGRQDRLELLGRQDRKGHLEQPGQLGRKDRKEFRVRALIRAFGPLSP